jgi:phage terminase small subunit
MAGKPNIVKTDIDLTAKQRKFVDIYVSNFGFISKTQAAKEAGYTAKDPNTIAAKLTNPNRKPTRSQVLRKKISTRTS